MTSMATSRPSKLKNTFATYKLATANKMHIGGMSSDSPIPTYNPGLGSSLEGPKYLDSNQEHLPFMIENIVHKTSDTLTMTPAGSHKLHTRLSCHQNLPPTGQVDNRPIIISQDQGDDFSIPDLESEEAQNLPGLGSVECLGPNGPFGRLGSIPEPIGGGLPTRRPDLGSVPANLNKQGLSG